MIKKILFGMMSLLTGMIFWASPVLAQTNIFNNGSDSVCKNPSTANSPVCKANPNNNPFSGSNNIIIKAAQIILLIVGVASVITIVIAGIRLTTSGGDPKGVGAAKNAIIYACIGLAVAASAEIIIVFVLNRLK